MNSRSFLKGTLCLFLALVAESLSLKPPVRASYQLSSSASASAAIRHSPLFLLRGGDAQEPGQVEETAEFDDKASVPPQKTCGGKIMSGVMSTGTGALMALGQFYSSSLESSPILTKSVTAAVLFAISDQMAQSLEFQRNAKKTGKKLDKPLLAMTSKKRSVYSGLVGLLYFGPMAHLWYGWIFRTFPGKSIVSILQKAVLGQFFFAPPLFCVFFAAALLQNGQFTFGNWFQKIKQDLVKGWLGGIGFWPIVNYISYAYVPQKYIPLFVNLMGLIFNIYVSFIANLKQGANKPKAS